MKNHLIAVAAGLIACSSLSIAQVATRDGGQKAAGDVVQDVGADVAKDLAQTVLSDVLAQGQEKVPDNVLVDVQPQLKTRVEPLYPRSALTNGTEGKVWVKILVDTAGRPAQVEVLKSEAEVFNEASLTAARQWLFTPAMKDNKPVAVWVTVPFRYKVAEKSGEHSPGTGADKTTPAVSEFMPKVEAIFAAGTSARAFIHPEAYLVDGTRYVNLNEALFGKEKGKCFAGESKRQRSFMKATIADDGTSALLVMRTENAKKGDPRWHTISWSREKGGEWKVTHWHTSR